VLCLQDPQLRLHGPAAREQLRQRALGLLRGPSEAGEEAAILLAEHARLAILESLLLGSIARLAAQVLDPIVYAQGHS